MTRPQLDALCDLLGQYADELLKRGELASWGQCHNLHAQASADIEALPGVTPDWVKQWRRNFGSEENA